MFVVCIKDVDWKNRKGQFPEDGGPRKGSVCTVNDNRTKHRHLMFHFVEHPGWYNARYFRPLDPSRLDIFLSTKTPTETPGDIKRKQMT